MKDGDALKKAIRAVNWNENAAQFAVDEALVDRVATCNYRLALWAKQLESADHANQALPFVRDMQASGQYVAALIALALYRPAAYGMRSVFEAALYYTYLRTHPAELRTLVRDPSFFLWKNDVVEYHKKHTEGFSERQHALGLLSDLETWYSHISAVAHGQTPGSWVRHTSLSDVKHHPHIVSSAVEGFEGGVDLVCRLFLCTVAPNLWDGFTAAAKEKLLRGIPAEKKAVLGLGLL